MTFARTPHKQIAARSTTLPTITKAGMITKSARRVEKSKQTAQRPTEVSKSVGAVVLNSRGYVLLVFQKKNKYWEFPKGKMEEGERELDTLRREIYEETGIAHFRLVRNFRKVMYYDFSYHDKVIRRRVVYYLIQTNERVHISDEHTGYEWTSLLRARRRLKHHNQIRLIQEVFTRVYGRTPTPQQQTS